MTLINNSEVMKRFWEYVLKKTYFRRLIFNITIVIPYSLLVLLTEPILRKAAVNGGIRL